MKKRAGFNLTDFSTAIELLKYLRRVISDWRIQVMTQARDGSKVKKLQVTFSASPFDEHYQMAFVYCFDKTQNYCFSLARFPEENDIEIMVIDQVVCRVQSLSVTLKGQTLTIDVEPVVAARLDGHDRYQVMFQDADVASMKLLKEALQQIFLGKNGLTVSVN